MRLPKKAIEALEDGLRLTNGHPLLYLDSARKLRRAGQYRDAVRKLRELLSDNPTRYEAWSDLSKTFEAAGKKREADNALMPLVVLGLNNEQTRKVARSRRAKTSLLSARLF